MKFSQMPYERPDLEQVKALYVSMIQRMKDAASYAEAKAVFLESEEFELLYMQRLGYLQQ